MKDLLEDLLFSGISELFCQFAHDIKNSKTTILLTAPPDIIGVLSLAPLEASLLDANISYRRRFTKKPNEYGPSINITNSDIASHLKLPPVKLHCSMLAEDAIKSAIKDFEKKNV